MLSMEKTSCHKLVCEKFSTDFQFRQFLELWLKRLLENILAKKNLIFFDEFSPESVNAASIGQVHKAKKTIKNLPWKIQYPEFRIFSVILKLVKPIAMKMFKYQKEGSESYFKKK